MPLLLSDKEYADFKRTLNLTNYKFNKSNILFCKSVIYPGKGSFIIEDALLKHTTHVRDDLAKLFGTGDKHLICDTKLHPGIPDLRGYKTTYIAFENVILYSYHKPKLLINTTRVVPQASWEIQQLDLGTSACVPVG